MFMFSAYDMKTHEQTKWKDNSQKGENICKWRDQQGINLQNIPMQLIKKNIQKNEWKASIDISPKKTYRWPRGT